MEKLTFGFSRLTDSNFETKAAAIVDAMTGNTNFPTPTPALADVTAAINAFDVALVNAKTLDRTDVAVKNQKREELNDLLVQLANYVMFTANGDKTILISSGFDLAKTPEPAPPLEKPENLQVEEGINPGQLFVSVKSVRSAKGYQFQCSTTDPTMSVPVWTSHFSTMSKYTISGLESGKRYWCRVGATGPYGQQVYSDVITKVVQ